MADTPGYNFDFVGKGLGWGTSLVVDECPGVGSPNASIVGLGYGLSGGFHHMNYGHVNAGHCTAVTAEMVCGGGETRGA